MSSFSFERETLDLSDDIVSLETDNQALRSYAAELEKENQVLREQINVLTSLIKEQKSIS